MTQRAVADQIEAELQGVCHPLLAVLGLDLIDIVHERIRSRVPALAAQLLDDRPEVDHDLSGDVVGVDAVVDLMCALYPEDPPPEWWRTPLGRRVAASIGTSDAEVVTGSVAAAILGLSRQRVHQLLEAGKLDRHPDGGVVRTSVLQRLVEMGPPAPRS